MKAFFSSFLRWHIYKLAAAFLAIILIIGCAVSWYFLYLKKTPEYSLDLIRRSIETHDSETFKKHVDIQNILACGYDDLMYVMIDSDKLMRPEAKEMLLSFSQILKAPVVSSFESSVIHFVDTGDWKDDAEIRQMSRYQALPDIQPEKLADKVGLQTIAYVGLENISEDESAASADIHVLETETQKEFVLNVKMDKLDDGSWRVTDIANTRDYLIEISQAKKEILKDYLMSTQPIVAKHQKIIQALQRQIQLLSPLKTQSDAVKALLGAQLAPQWSAFGEELASIAAPNAAREISQLRAKTIELRQKYVEKQLEQIDAPSPKLENDLKTLERQATELSYRIDALVKHALADK